MKFSIFTVMTPDMTKLELVDALAEFGYEGVEWRFKETSEELKAEKPSFWRNNLCTIDPNISDAELDTLYQATQSKGIKVISVTPYLECGDLEGTECVMKIAKKLGAPQIRVGVPNYDGTTNYNVLFEQAVHYLNGVQDLSIAYGVKGLVETHHKRITPSAGLAHRLVSQFDPNHIGVLFDPGNMVHEGYENYRMGLELLGPYLANVHVKNAIWKQTEQPEDGTLVWRAEWSPVHAGIVDWKQVLKDLKAVGYDGYLGFEDFSGAKSSRELLQENPEYIHSLLAQI
jgi:sugar phosphate isomerase/epimerase